MDSFKAEEWDWGVGGLSRSSSRKRRQPWEDTKQRCHRPSTCFTADVAVFVQHRPTRLPHVLIRKYYKHDPDQIQNIVVLSNSDFNLLHVCFVSCVCVCVVTLRVGVCVGLCVSTVHGKCFPASCVCVGRPGADGGSVASAPVLVWFRLRLIVVDTGGAGGSAVGVSWPPQSSIFEVLSGRGTLSLGPSLSSARRSVCCRVCVDIVSGGQGSAGREGGSNSGSSQETRTRKETKWKGKQR